MKWLIVATGLLYSIPVHAQVADAWVTMGMKEDTCAQWTSAKSEASFEYVIKRTWVSGVVSGYNAAKGGNIAEGTNGAGVFGWVDHYCEQNPLDRLSTAARNLIGELAKRQSR